MIRSTFLDDEPVLDIGCGDGKVTALLALSVPQGSVTGIDNSEKMISFAQENFPSSRCPNSNFIRMDAADLIFREQFDVVYFNAALHWIKDRTSVLRGVEKSLKSSGRLLFQMGGKGNAKDILDIVEALVSEDPWRFF
ncbi:MAG: class I SAM-dependent methyltransferase [Candidatus Aureabacteria bacterium]|nr:class I SAM-dependent methyltransferase [Candidatus Auribacterota bacterium]